MVPFPTLWVPLAVTFIAVGQGDATLIVSPAGKSVLVDGGPHESAAILEAAVRQRLGKAPLDLVILSHRHADHLGGLERVIGSQGARLYMDSAFPHESPAFSSLLRLLEARAIPIREAQPGRRVELGGEAVLTVLGPPDAEHWLRGTRSDVNANSVIARLDYKRASVLLTGDAESASEALLLRGGAASLRARVLKVAHHGSRFSSTDRFLRAVRPEIAVVPVGPVNDYHHPHPQALARLRAVGARVYRTDQDGDVTCESDGDAITVRTGKDKQP